MVLRPDIVVAAAHHPGELVCLTLLQACQAPRKTLCVRPKPLKHAAEHYDHRLSSCVEGGKTVDHVLIVSRIAVVVNIALAEPPFAAEILKRRVDCQEFLVGRRKIGSFNASEVGSE